ncbi:MAG TPA: SDR family NAD(P)-dependent oxidoreductase [Acidimicrobiales bacterium]
MRLERGQVAVVTGGASGIGLGLANAFADRGLDVVIADVSEARLADAVSALEAKGVAALGLRTDVRSLAEVQALAAAAIERFGRIDIVCNNAGVVSAGVPMWDVPVDDWDWVMDVNLGGVLNGIRAFVPHLVAQGTGHVVNTASMAGLVPQPTASAYVASKCAVVGISECLALELELFAPGVGVTVLCPGTVDTDILSSGRDTPSEMSMAEMHEQLAGGAASATMGAGIASPADAAAAVLDAIENDRLYTAPNGSPGEVRARADRLVADMEQS